MRKPSLKREINRIRKEVEEEIKDLGELTIEIRQKLESVERKRGYLRNMEAEFANEVKEEE